MNFLLFSVSLDVSKVEIEKELFVSFDGKERENYLL